MSNAPTTPSSTPTPEQSQPTIRAVDLFCGAGGLSWGLVKALREVAIEAPQSTEAVLEETIDLVAVNHDATAIESHQQNHPWARHFHDDVQNIDPREVFDERNPDVKILSGGIECTHWSAARGGKPVDPQERMPAWDTLTWVQKLRPSFCLFENVPEFTEWGPVEDDGTPTRTGETFEQWIDSLHALGYSVDWQVLNAADFGDATSRERLFILASREGRPSFPEPTHSDTDNELPDRRVAAEVIDWSDPGGSIFTRDIGAPRKKPLKNSTLERIADGLRRHGDTIMEPFADALETLTRDDVRRLRRNPVPAEYADLAAAALEEPFLVAADGPPVSPRPMLVKYYGTSTTAEIDEPIGTITSGGQKFGLCIPSLLGQHSNSIPRDVTARPTPTITTGGKLQVTTPEAYLLRQQSGGTPPAMSDQMPTISTAGSIAKVESRPLSLTTSSSRQALDSTDTAPAAPAPFIDDYEGPADALDEPLGTVTSRDRFGLAVPEVFEAGHQLALDVRYRMLQPAELRRAQGFEDDYELCGTKTERIEQIGNAVPVNLAQTLVESLLSSTLPSLTDYLDDDRPSVNTETKATPSGARSDD